MREPGGVRAGVAVEAGWEMRYTAGQGRIYDKGTLSHNWGLMSWQGHLEPVLIPCWEGSWKLPHDDGSQ